MLLNIWQSFATGDYSVKLPPDWTSFQIDSTRIGFLPVNRQPDTSLEYVGDIMVGVFPNPSQLGLVDFYRTVAAVDLFANSTASTSFPVNGVEGVKFSDVFGMIPTNTIAVNKSQNVIEISDVGQLHVVDQILDLMASSIR